MSSTFEVRERWRLLRVKRTVKGTMYVRSKSGDVEVEV
jgi:hypothetical protein